MTDGELVQRIVRGERDAEAELCRRFAPRIRLYGLRHLRCAERAADLVQDVLLAVIVAARAGRIEEPELVHRFVLGTCRNVALRVRERAARTTPAADVDVGVAMPELERIDIEPLIHCLGGLDERSRMVVVLSFHDEGPDAIAMMAGTTPGNVRVLRHRALANLRRCLDARESAS